MYTFLDLIPSNCLIIASIEPSNELAGIEIDSKGRDELSTVLFNADENVFKLVNKSLSKVIVLSPNNTGSVGSFPLLLFNPKNIYWDTFSVNSHPYAIELLKANQDKINWSVLSSNPHPDAIELLKANRDKINWSLLSLNPTAIELLKANPDKINWDALSENPAIFDEILE